MKVGFVAADETSSRDAAAQQVSTDIRPELSHQAVRESTAERCGFTLNSHSARAGHRSELARRLSAGGGSELEPARS